MRDIYEEISKNTLMGQAIHGLAGNAGAPAQANLVISGVVVSAETFVVNGITYEMLEFTTAAGTATGGEFNNTTNPLVGVTLTAHGAAVGDYIMMESEFMEVIAVDDANTVNLARGALGSTPAAHIDTSAAFLNDTSPTAGEVQIGLTDGATAATAAADIVTGYNAAGDQGVGNGIRAAVGSGTNVVFTWFESKAFPTTEAMANGAFGNGAAAGLGAPKGQGYLGAMTRTITNSDLDFAFNFPVQNALVLIAGKAYDGAVTINGNVVAPDNAGAVDAVNADVVSIIAIG